MTARTSPRSPLAMRLALTTAALALALAGCAKPPPPRAWLSLPTLPVAPERSSPAGALSADAVTWIVQRVRVPEYLQSTQVRFRDAPHVLAEWPNVRWAERLEVNLGRHLSQHLSAAMPPGTVCEAPCRPSATPGSVWVSYQALDYVRAQREVVALVQWERVVPGQPPVAQQWQLREPVAVDSPSGQADAMGRLNQALARRIAATLTGAQAPN